MDSHGLARQNGADVQADDAPRAMTETVRFGVLGPLRVWQGQQELDLGPPQQRLILAVLLVRPGEVVGADDLVDALWESAAPASAKNLIHRYVGALRRVLEPDLPPRAAGRWLVRQGSGYVLRVDGDSADIVAFRDLVNRARSESDAVAMSSYVEAFQLWRGLCGEGLALTAQAKELFTSINNEFAVAADAMGEVALRCGRAEDALPILRTITARFPLNERIQARLMLVLAATGQQAEALEVYRTTTARLADELGIDPGPELRAAHAQVSRAEQPAGQPAAASIARPAQLPMDLSTFGGRRAELDHLRHLLDSGDPPVTIIAIDGMPGAGKTTTAVHLAHEVVDRYPDGQLYVNLRGFDPSGLAVPPTAALLSFLAALGVHGDRVPPDLATQSALYRTCLAGKRMLVVLDNARDREQVLPLLPGSPSCLVIVTSRNRMTGLVAMEGARPYTLDAVSASEAREILALRLGARSDEQHEAVDRIVEVCSGLPLALAMVAARAATYPDLPLTAIADELRTGHGNLDALSHDETRGVRAVFSWSYEALRPQAALLFRLLSWHWGPDISAHACASLLGVPVREAQTALVELNRTRLVTEHVPGRFLMHDLVRAYAMELSTELDAPDVREQAAHRMFDYYLHSTHAANRPLMPHREVPLTPLTPGVTPETLFDDGTAIQWLAAEYHVVLMAIGQAIERGKADYAWRLAWAIQLYQHYMGFLRDWALTAQVTLEATRAAGDLRGQVFTERSLAGAYFMLGDGKASLQHLYNTLDLINAGGWADEESAYVERNIGEVMITGTVDLQPDYEAAISHFERAHKYYTKMNHMQGVAYTLEGQAVAYMRTGDPERSIDLLNQALPLHRQLNDRTGEGYAYARLADTYLQLGRLDEAEAWLDKAIDLHTKSQHRLMEIDNLVLLGDIRTAQNDAEGARQAWRQALEVAERFGALTTVVELRTRLGESEGVTGDEGELGDPG